ncbi:hypothetical protein OIV83_005109 [Microbotryomycetes sp. JL201]|nr:hypothetical protein OIV83_005109 [Microbotryomycetes sp. JL201]
MDGGFLDHFLFRFKRLVDHWESSNVSFDLNGEPWNFLQADLTEFKKRSFLCRSKDAVAYTHAAALDALHGYNQELLLSAMNFAPAALGTLETLFWGADEMTDLKFYHFPRSESQLELFSQASHSLMHKTTAQDNAWRQVMLRELHVARFAFRSVLRLPAYRNLSNLIFVVMEIFLLDLQHTLTYVEKCDYVRQAHPAISWTCNFDALQGSLAEHIHAERDEYARLHGQEALIGQWVNYRRLDGAFNGLSASELLDHLEAERRTRRRADRRLFGRAQSVQARRVALQVNPRGQVRRHASA